MHPKLETGNLQVGLTKILGRGFQAHGSLRLTLSIRSGAKHRLLHADVIRQHDAIQPIVPKAD